MRVYLETMGCQMNRLDSELVTSLLRAAGHEMTDDRKAADVVLYNTCSVRQHAEDKVHSRLGAEARRKANRPGLVVGVLGCMAQRLGEDLQRRWAAVDIICAPGQLARLPELIAAARAGRPGVALDPDRRKRGQATFSPPGTTEGPVGSGRAASDEPADDGKSSLSPFSLDLSRDPAATPRRAQAYLRVMRGCDKFCTYCIVPFVRGRETSRDPRTIAEEARRLVGAGRTEITLLGQTVNSYRWADGERVVRFSDLLERVAGLVGLRRLRFVTSHPADFERDILEAMRDLPAVCEYLHCPAQSGSDAVLKRMNRGYARADYDALVDRARDIVPGVALAGDFIVGFPGETEDDHAASADLIRRSGYKNSFVFKYSPRPGTTAARRLDDDVPQPVKRRRNNELLAVQEEAGLAHHRAYVGRQVEVLVEGPSARFDKQAAPPRGDAMQLTGRTRGDHIVVFDGPPSLAGEYVKVAVREATALTLVGELVR
jgi:tRNA-2-methylthio-N6-dimethylallyladenosine synthase